MFTDSTTKVDNEPPNGSNEDITNPYECEQTLNVSRGTLNLSAGNPDGGSSCDEVLKLKNFKKDDYTSFQDKEKYEHVGPKVTRSQEGKRLQDDEKRLCLVDDLKKLKIAYKSS
ncbi:hypothetical protein Tco_0508819 [Tanacetum coccineum]